MVFENLFINLIIELGRYYTKPGFTPSKKMLKFSHCIASLENTFDQNQLISDIIETHGFSVSHFIRTFKKIYHITPLQYVLQLRLAKSVDLLESSDLNITEIAYQCGFSDSNYFSRIFKQRMNQSPGQFRKKL